MCIAVISQARLKHQELSPFSRKKMLGKKTLQDAIVLLCRCGGGVGEGRKKKGRKVKEFSMFFPPTVIGDCLSFIFPSFKKLSAP